MQLYLSSGGMLAFFALLPVLAIFTLMAGFRMPATRAMPAAFGLTLLLVIFIWGLPLNWVAAATVNGIVIAIKILLIVFGALALLFTLRESGAIAAINQGFISISPDKRIQAVIITWLFGGFIEGASGFGTPAALTAPLLLSVGFPALAAVMVALIANSTAVSFGAVGTPTIIGIGTSLDLPFIHQTLASYNMGLDEFIHLTGSWSAVIHALPGLFVPLIMLVMLTGFFGRKRSFRDGLMAWPYALFAAVCFIFPYIIVARYIGPEFPSIIGGLAGMLVLVPATRAGFLVPKKTWDFPEKSSWPERWSGTISMAGHHKNSNLSLSRSWMPYAIIGLLLIITRVRFLPFSSWLMQAEIQVKELFGTTVSTSFDPLYNPGILPFMLVAIICIPLFSMKATQVRVAWREALTRTKGPAIALLFTVPMVRLMMQSGNNPAGLPGMPIAMAEYMAGLASGIWPLISPFVGALGAFVAGSNAVSNMLFSLFQYTIAEQAGFSRILTVSLQNAGGAIGNMIGVHNIIAACATVGLAGAEGWLLKRNIIPVIILCLLAALSAAILLLLAPSGLF